MEKNAIMSSGSLPPLASWKADTSPFILGNKTDGSYIHISTVKVLVILYVSCSPMQVVRNQVIWLLWNELLWLSLNCVICIAFVFITQ